MSLDTIKQFIKLFLQEIKKKKTKKRSLDIDEFSGVGAIAGYTGPISSQNNSNKNKKQ